MAGALIWNGNTTTLSRPFTSWTNTINADTTYRTSLGGVHTTCHRYYLWRVAFTVETLSITMERQLLTWWSWAMRCNYFAVAKDSTKVANTVLNGVGAAAGQAVIPVAATTSITAGDLLLLSPALRDGSYEVIQVQSVSAGVSITATTNLVNSWAAGDYCRTLDYLPRCVSVDTTYPVINEDIGKSNYLTLSCNVEEDIAL
jgi:hypothetical protein